MLTNEELQSIAIGAFEETGDGLKLIRATVVKFPGNEDPLDSDQSYVAWIKFVDSRQRPDELIFTLQSSEVESVRQEIVRHLSSSRTSIRNTIDVKGSVSGMLIGTNTGVINKNFFGGDTYHQVQLYVLSDSGRGAGLSKLIGQIREPYKFLSPYDTLDLPIFQGRHNETTQVLRIVHEQRLVVISAEASVGKTSLLAAGVIPQLLEEGALVIKIQDYGNPVEVISQAIKSEAANLAFPMPDAPDLVSLVKAISEASKGTLVLVLDQFELLFEASISPAQREDFIDQLASCLRQIHPDLLRVIIAIRDEAKAKLWEHQERLPDLLRCQFPLLPLDRDQAALAIKEPLRIIKSQVSFHGDVIERLLVPGLAELGSGDDPNFVHPPHLQIVCSWLYRKATATDPPRIIDKEMLDEANGADGIFASYLEETLEKLEDERRFASRVMALMTRPEVEKWVLPDELQAMNPDVSTTDIERVLKTLVAAGLLVRRAGDNRYAFVSPTVAEEILRLAGPEVEKRSQATNELERVWLSWLARNALASGEQLRYLASFGTHLTPRAVRTLLLLRSSVEQGEPTTPWLNLFGNDEGRALIYQLEGLPLTDDLPVAGETVLAKAEKLLDLPSANPGDHRDSELNSVGLVSINAVNNRSATVRQTCALALLSVADDEAVALGRLDRALAQKGKQQRKVRAELRGALADADPGIETINKSLPLLDRSLIWRWRAFRRIGQDRRRWIALMLGGALGAGLSLALMRTLISIAATNPIQPGIQFGIFLYFGFILGGSLVFGMALAKPLSVGRVHSRDLLEQQPGRADSTLSTLLAFLLGGVVFGVANIFEAVINGLSPFQKPLVLLLGFVAGFGLSAAIAVGRQMQSRVSGWLINLGIAGGVWMIVQFVFTLSKDPGDGIPVAWLGWFYESNFSGYSWWPSVIRYVPNFPDLLAIIDSALAGIFLVAGTTIGMAAAEKYLIRLREG